MKAAGMLIAVLMGTILSCAVPLSAFAGKPAENKADYGVEEERLREAYRKQKDDYENAFAGLMNRANEKARKYEAEHPGYVFYSEGFLLYMGFKTRILPVLLAVTGVTAVIFYFIGSKYPKIRRLAWLLFSAAITVLIATALVGIRVFNTD